MHQVRIDCGIEVSVTTEIALALACFVLLFVSSIYPIKPLAYLRCVKIKTFTP